VKLNMKRVFMLLALAGIIGLAAGHIYERRGEIIDKERLPQVGRSVDIGGRNLNIFCSGVGAPAVIFESAGGPGYFSTDIQGQVAKVTTACWYDRAGEGWSDAGPFPRTSASIASDLRELLHRAPVPSPYVLVGWSFGGLNVRVYNGLYPNDVAGMVLVDSAHEDEPLRAPKFFLARTAPTYLRYPFHLVLQAVLPQSTVGNLCSIRSQKSTYFPFSSQTELMTLNSAVTFCSQITYSNVTNN
jgi:pimeloyl-ACP methyl ester carboxylesterase